MWYLVRTMDEAITLSVNSFSLDTSLHPDVFIYARALTFRQKTDVRGMTKRSPLPEHEDESNVVDSEMIDEDALSLDQPASASRSEDDFNSDSNMPKSESEQNQSNTNVITLKKEPITQQYTNWVRSEREIFVGITSFY